MKTFKNKLRFVKQELVVNHVVPFDDLDQARAVAENAKGDQK